MSELFLTMFTGFCMLMMLYVASVIYIIVGSLIGDSMDDLGFSYRVSLTSVILGPGILVATIYLLGQFAIGVVLSGGFN